MQKLFKLTKQDGTNYNGYMYGIEGKIHEKPYKENPQLCSKDVFHAYKNQNLAFFLNPIHANIDNPRLWEIEGDIVCQDFGKVGSFTQKVVKELEIPSWIGSENESKVRLMFAILCSENVLSVWNEYDEKDTRVINTINTAKEYLKNPSDAAAYAAYAAARAAARAAADAAACAARAAADAAADPAYAAADAAAYAARAAADAARAAGVAEIDFCKLADKAVEMILSGDF